MIELKEIKKLLMVRAYSPNTISSYLACLNYFKKYFRGSEIDDLKKEDIIDYLFHLIKNNYSKSTQNQHINAIKFYFEKCLEKERVLSYR